MDEAEPAIRRLAGYDNLEHAQNSSGISTGVEKDVTVLGFKIRYREAGSGPAVILLHGLGGDGSRWAPNIVPLPRQFRVIALDQIGFGQSDKPLVDYHTGMLADFLARFMSTIGVAQASLASG